MSQERRKKRKERRDMTTHFSLVPFIMVMAMLVATNICRAAATGKSNYPADHRCHNRSGKCLIGDMESDEFSMDSETGRRLLQVNIGAAVTAGTGDANQPATPCGNPRYKKCLPNSNKPNGGPNCGIFNRECP